MTFQNYNTKNDAISTLLAGISASATSVQVQSADGVKFPTGNFVATIIQYTNKLDRTSAIVKKEKVLVSTNATDTFTITRGFGGDTPTAFETGDTIVLNVVSEVIEDIQDEVARLESDKLNKGGLRTALVNTWRMFFSNGSNAETELAFGASGRVLQSNGATSSPTWEVPTVDINSLSEDATGNLADDFFIKNNGIGANTKIKLTRYKASDAEATAGTDDTKYMSPKNVKDNYLARSQVISGTFTFDDVPQSNITISHGLGRAPKSIQIILMDRVSGTGITINDYSVRGAWSNNNGSITNIAYSNGDNGGYWETISTTNGDIMKLNLGSGEGTWKVDSTSSTNVVFSYSYTDFGTLYNFVYDVYFQIIA